MIADERGRLSEDLHESRPRTVRAELDVSADTPSIVVNLEVVRANLEHMASYARRVGVALRPHAKTHKSSYFARAQIELGSNGVCVAKVGEAAALRDAGINELFIAYPVIGPTKLRRLEPLVADGGILLGGDSEAVFDGYSQVAQAVDRSIEVLVEVDSGMRRTGVGVAEVVRLAEAVERMDGLEFAGIFTHAGQTHDCTDQLGVERVARQEAAIMGAAREALEGAGLAPRIVSAGSTITAPYLSSDDGITEIRPGTYIFNDLRTLELFACRADDIAATMVCSVVSRHDDYLVIDAGNKTLTLTCTPAHGYGYLRGLPQTRFVRLSEEHGVVDLGPETTQIGVGDRVAVVPVHICAWVDLQREVYGLEADGTVTEIRIEAMRQSR